MERSQRRWPAALAAALIAAVAAVGLWVAAGHRTAGAGPAGAQPVALHLSSPGLRYAASVDTVGEGAYRLTGSLPDGPTRAAVRSLGKADAAIVGRLATELHLPAPTTTDSGWQSTDGTHTLSVVAATGAWNFGPSAGDCVAVGAPPNGGTSDSGTVNSDATVNSGATVGCGSGGVAVGSATGSGVGSSTVSGAGPATGSADAPDVPGPPALADKAQALKAAESVLNAAGMDLSSAVIANEGGTVLVTPRVDGLRTVGWESSVTSSQDTTVLWANGWLGTPVKGAVYPLVTARQAFDQLLAQPRPEPMICAPVAGGEAPAPESAVTGAAADDSATASSTAAAIGGTATVEPGPVPVPPVCGHVDVPPVDVTGAELGLQLQWTDTQQPLLVPAWLFTTGPGYVMPQVAIDPTYLGGPSEPAVGKSLPPDNTVIPPDANSIPPCCSDPATPTGSLPPVVGPPVSAPDWSCDAFADGSTCAPFNGPSSSGPMTGTGETCPASPDARAAYEQKYGVVCPTP